MTHSFTLLVIYALAVFRLCRLVIDDTITAPFRGRLAEWAHIGKVKHGDWTRQDKWRRGVWNLATCYGCLSMWVAAVVTALAYVAGAWWPWICAGLALSSVTGFIAEKV